MSPAIPSDADLLRQIEKFCTEQGMGVTTFGRNALGDPNLVANMRRGRSLTLKTAAAVAAYIGHSAKHVTCDHAAADAAAQQAPSTGQCAELSGSQAIRGAA